MPYSCVMPLPPWVCTARSAASQAASAAAYLAMLAASPAPMSSPAGLVGVILATLVLLVALVRAFSFRDAGGQRDVEGTNFVVLAIAGLFVYGLTEPLVTIPWGWWLLRLVSSIPRRGPSSPRPSSDPTRLGWTAASPCSRGGPARSSSSANNRTLTSALRVAQTRPLATMWWDRRVLPPKPQ